MVCKNCGADLKPGIKYCLNCGYYLDDENEKNQKKQKGKKDKKLSSENIIFDDSSADEDFSVVDGTSFEDFGDNSDSGIKTNRKKMTKKDILIYGGLIFVIVISLIVIFVSLVSGGKKTTVKPQSTNNVVEDNVVKMKDYTIKFSGKLNYNQDGQVLYISDEKKYSFSYRNSLDDFEKYSKDMTILEKSLKKSGYIVINSEKRDVNGTDFLIYKFKLSGDTKYLYVTKINKKYITMGTIEELNGGDWTEALNVINKINSTIKINNDSDSDSDVNNVLNSNTTDLSKIIG